MRLHQARLHGWGVVCGLNVVPHPNTGCRTRYVVVEPGSAVDCCGHDILVPEEEILDLLCYRKVADLAKENPAHLHALGICVRFIECPTENVPVLYDDCGCNNNGCAPNRILESYAFDVILDPPLSWLKKVQPADIAGAVFLRPPATGLGAHTPRIGIAVIAGTTLYALDAEHAQNLIAFDLVTRHGMTLDLGADAFGIAGNENFVFVATAPKSGGTTPIVQVFQPGGGTGALVTFDTGTAAANTLSIGASSDPARAAILYVNETGDLLAFAPDATNGLVGPAASLGTIAANLKSFAVTPDGSTAYAIDTGRAKVKAITLAAASSTTDLAASLSGASPTSLAYWESGGKKLLAVASGTGKTLNLVDLGASNVLGSLHARPSAGVRHGFSRRSCAGDRRGRRSRLSADRRRRAARKRPARHRRRAADDRRRRGAHRRFRAGRHSRHRRVVRAGGPAVRRTHVAPALLCLRQRQLCDARHHRTLSGGRGRAGGRSHRYACRRHRAKAGAHRQSRRPQGVSLERDAAGLDRMPGTERHAGAGRKGRARTARRARTGSVSIPTCPRSSTSPGSSRTRCRSRTSCRDTRTF